MTLRKPLRRRISAAWEKCIEQDFKTHRLNSERSLQAAFWFRLTEELTTDDKRSREIFIEPHLFIPDSGHLFPDVMICDSHQIIGVIELKYQPRRPPSFDKDLGTLNSIWSCEDKTVGISTRRNCDPNLKSKKYRISRDVLLVWAGVHRTIPPEDKKPILPESVEAQQFFLRLHAETGDSKDVITSSFSGGE